MANLNPNTVGLSKSKWQNKPTIALRVPAVFAVKLQEICYLMDYGDADFDIKVLSELETELNRIKNQIRKIKKSIQDCEPGYKEKSARRLIEEIGKINL